MITITNGQMTISVSKGAFENTYKKQGFKLVKQSKVKQNGSKSTGDAEIDAIIDAIEGKPFAQWKKEDMKKYVELKDIDTSAATNFQEAKEIVKKAIDEVREESE